jgi:hypothetical protein
MKYNSTIDIGGFPPPISKGKSIVKKKFYKYYNNYIFFDIREFFALQFVLDDSNHFLLKSA